MFFVEHNCPYAIATFIVIMVVDDGLSHDPIIPRTGVKVEFTEVNPL